MFCCIKNEVTAAIATAKAAGVMTVMITGDYVMTAKAIAENIGLLPRGSPAERAVDCAAIRFDLKIQSECRKSIQKKEMHCHA